MTHRHESDRIYISLAIAVAFHLLLFILIPAPRVQRTDFAPPLYIQLDPLPPTVQTPAVEEPVPHPEVPPQPPVTPPPVPTNEALAASSTGESVTSAAPDAARAAPAVPPSTTTTTPPPTTPMPPRTASPAADQAPPQSTPSPAVTRPAPAQSAPAPPVTRPAPTQSTPAPPVTTPAPSAGAQTPAPPATQTPLPQQERAPLAPQQPQSGAATQSSDASAPTPATPAVPTAPAQPAEAPIVTMAPTAPARPAPRPSFDAGDAFSPTTTAARSDQFVDRQLADLARLQSSYRAEVERYIATQQAASTQTAEQIAQTERAVSDLERRIRDVTQTILRQASNVVPAPIAPSTAASGPGLAHDGDHITIGEGAGTRRRLEGGAPDLSGLTLPAYLPPVLAVRVRFNVSADGSVLRAWVDPPTGFPALDTALESTVRLWRFQPVAGRSGSDSHATPSGTAAVVQGAVIIEVETRS